MQLNLDLFKLNKIDWPNPDEPEPNKSLFLTFLLNVQEFHGLGPKLISFLIEDPDPSDPDHNTFYQDDLSRRPRTISHYNLSTIHKAMDMSA